MEQLGTEPPTARGSALGARGNGGTYETDMEIQHVSFKLGQKLERAGRWREARDTYERAGARRSAREMGERLRETILEDLTHQIIRAIVAREENQYE